MKKMKNLLAVLATAFLAFQSMAQEAGGTYIDSMNVQDSSYMQQDLLKGAEETSSGNTSLYVMVAVVVILIVVFVVLRKKRKK